MGDTKTLAMARKELEEMYAGVPDDSVNLSFQHLAHHHHHHHHHLSPAKLPSPDLGRAFQQASHTPSPGAMDQRSFNFMSDDMTHVSAAAYGGGGGGGRRRRPGIPHSNTCAVCSTYIYIFRHRCLVCGRVYCRQCVAVGMGEMAEGRKCKDCLGRRFSLKYIGKAGNVGCCFGYPSTVKQQELKWAEKGPRTGGGAAAHPHRRATRPPPIPTSHHSSNPPSFIAYSPYSFNNLHQFGPL